jgi:hypothetical protein
MPQTTYTYSIAGDLPSGKVNAEKLDIEIRDSSILTALSYLIINPDDDDADRIDIIFKDALSVGDKTILDGDTTAPAGGLIALHDNTETTPKREVKVNNFSTLENSGSGHEVQRVVIQPARTDYFMNFRDFMIKTSVVADSFEDLKVNPSDNKRLNWDEMSFVGCYKGDDTVGFTVCDDQADADANATLSIWDYVATDQAGTPAPIDVDMMGGVLWVDPALVGTGDDLWKHQCYALMAPNLPASIGGSVPFFDSYLYPRQGEWLSALNTLALTLDPSVTVEAARIRIWVYYPAGAKQTHVLGLKSYRKKW